MKRLVYLFGLISLLSTSGLFAQPVPAARKEAVQSDAFSFYNGKGAGALHFLDSLYGISYVPNTSFYSITTDGGTTWRDGMPNPLVSPVRKMFTTGRDTLVAVRDSSLILHSYNAGETWSLVNTLWSGDYLNNFLFFNSRYGVNIKGNGEFMISSDRGINWITTSWQFRKVKPTLFYNSGYLFAIETPLYPSPAKIIYSTNNGYGWDSLVLPSTITDYTYIARGSSGFILGTSNGTVYLISEQGAILKQLSSPGLARAGGYSYANDRTIWCIDTDLYGTIKGLSIYSVIDSATSYIPETHTLRYADNIASTTFDKVIIGSGSMYSSSGLMTYHRYGFMDVRVETFEIPGGGEATSLFFVNETKGFAGGSTGWIKKTTDGGLSWEKSTVPPFNTIIGFAKRSDTEFIAFCGGGTILESSDDGLTWVSVGSRFKGTIKKVAFSGRDTIFFCTADSLYMTTPSWQVITPINTGISGGTYCDLDFYGPFNGSATYHTTSGTSGKAVVTTDGGKTWATRSFDGWLLTYDPGSGGLFFRSATQLGTWYDGSGGRSTDVTAYPDQYDQNSNGKIALTSGANSIFFSFGDKASYRHIFIENNSERKGIVASGGNTFYLLYSGNRFWKFSNSTTSVLPTTVLRNYPGDGSPYEYHNLKFKWEEPWSVAPITEYHFQLALGDTSNIVSNLSGLDSTSVTLNLTADSTIYFWRVRAANRNGWGSFNNWYRFRSSVLANEPKGWQTALTTSLSAAVILPDGSVVVGDTMGQVSRTSSPPNNWVIIDANTSYPLYRFWLEPNYNLIYAYTAGSTYFLSTNKGVSWRRIDMPFGGSIAFRRMTTDPQNRYYGAGDYGTVYKGVLKPTYLINWTSLYFSPYTGSNLAIDTWGTSAVVAAGQLGSVTISTDGGVSFRHISLDQTETYHEAGFAPDGTLVLLNQKGERRISTDMGVTWTFESFETKAPVRDMITMDGVSVLVDKLGGIYTAPTPKSEWHYLKLPYGELPVAVNIAPGKILLPAEHGKLFFMPVNYANLTGVKDEGFVAAEFTLTQNYPNPFNPETVIRYALPVAGYAKGVVYDILGKEVATLVNGEMPAGEHRLSFNAANLPSGVYIFRLESGKYSAAIKMLLAK